MVLFDSLSSHPRLVEFASTLNVPHLLPNLPLLLQSCAFFFAVQFASQLLTPVLLPSVGKLSKRTRSDWDLHFVGWVHGLISTPLALYFILNPSPELVKDAIYGYSPREGVMFAISGGYFLYDLIISLYYLPTHGFPFVLHAVACCFIFFKAFTPLLNGFACHFLVWEFSTIFLHPHWFMDKLNMTGSVLQLVNGIALVLAFVGSRIVYGGYMTFVLWKVLDDPNVSPALRWGFRAANLALDGLNWSWLRLMLISLAKRFKAREEKQKKGQQVKETPNEDVVEEKKTK